MKGRQRKRKSVSPTASGSSALFCLPQITGFWLLFQFYELRGREILSKRDSDILASFHFVCKSHNHISTIRLLSREHKQSQFVGVALQMLPAMFVLKVLYVGYNVEMISILSQVILIKLHQLQILHYNE